jgi:hypothetical protein
MSHSPILPVLTPEQVARLRALVRERLAARRAEEEAAPPEPAPLYDEVFFQGVAWLDRCSYEDSWEDVAPAL